MRGGYRIPMHGNLLVPYVTRYSSEAPDLIAHNAKMGFQEIVNMQGPNGETLYYLDDRADPPACWRDDLGVLWVPAPDDRSGKVEFSQVHPLRHRRCMAEFRCQVCAKPAGPRVRFRLPLSDIVGGFDIVTSHAPVCDRCLRAAKVKCPHLVRHAGEWFTIEVGRKSVERCGVVGDVVDISGGFLRQGRVMNDDPYMPQTLARQQLVRIDAGEIDILERP